MKDRGIGSIPGNKIGPLSGSLLDILSGFEVPMDSTDGRTFTAGARKIMEDRSLSKTDRQKIFNESYYQVP